jgi:hypothetical protein
MRMRWRAAVAALALSMAAGAGSAQTPGSFESGVLTADALDAAFAAKQDVIGTLAANTVLGSIPGGPVASLTAAQLTTLCNPFTSALSGCVPASGGGSVNFLRADGTWTTPPAPAPPRSYLAGLTLSPGGTQIVTVASGQATSDDTTTGMVLTASLSKSLAANWASGASNGCLDAGSVASGAWYHVFLIARTDTGAVDVLCSVQVTTPVLPSPYTKQRRLGSILTNSSDDIVTFVQNGDEFIWLTPPQDVSASTLTTASRSLYTLSVAPGVKVNALIRAAVTNASTGFAVVYTSPDENDQAPGSANADAWFNGLGDAAGRYNIRTSTSGQIGARANAASTTLSITTFGYIDTRGRFN